MNVTNQSVIEIIQDSNETTKFVLGGYITNATANIILDVVNCGILPALTISGLTMNIISFFVLILQRFKSRANVVLLGLTISDSVFLLATFVRKFSSIVAKFEPVMGKNLQKLMMPQVYLIGIVCARITSLLTVLISTERLAVVLWPLRTRMMLTLTRIKIMVVFIFIFTSVSFIPLFFVLETSHKYSKALNRYIVVMVETKFYLRNRAVLDYYANLVLNILFRFTPCVIVTATTTTLVIYLRRHIRWRIRSTNLNKADLILEEKRVTKTLIALSTMYVVFLMPGTVITIARLVCGNFDWNGQYHNLFTVISSINIVLECSNSSFNFIIYMSTSRSFATQFQTIRRRHECVRTSNQSASRLTHL